jgi:hypothetical protein
MAYKREIPISVSIDITLKDKNMSCSEILNLDRVWFRERFGDTEPVERVFRFCLSVLLEQDAYDQDEVKEATRIISELTNHEDGFNITSKEA